MMKYMGDEGVNSAKIYEIVLEKTLRRDVEEKLSNIQDISYKTMCLL